MSRRKGGAYPPMSGSTSVKVTVEPFRFLNLPPELRNRVYELVLENDRPPNARLSRMHRPKFSPPTRKTRDLIKLYHTRKRFGLKEGNKQIRAEFRIWWLESRQVMVDALDLRAWGETFYPDCKDLDHAPVYLGIDMENWYELADPPALNILPLRVMRLCYPSFQFHFEAQNGHVGGPADTLRNQMKAKGLRKVDRAVGYVYEQWDENIRRGEVLRMEVRRVPNGTFKDSTSIHIIWTVDGKKSSVSYNWFSPTAS